MRESGWRQFCAETNAALSSGKSCQPCLCRWTAIPSQLFEKIADISIKLSSSVVHHSDAVDAEMDGEVVAMNAAKGVCFGLNPVGSRVWQLTASPIRVAEICEILQREYDVDAATCEQQAVAMLEAMVREDLVEITPGA